MSQLEHPVRSVEPIITDVSQVEHVDTSVWPVFVETRNMEPAIVLYTYLFNR